MTSGLFILIYLVLMKMLDIAVSLQPNIIWIMADDLGWGEVEVFPANSTHGRISTPMLNKFAAEGLLYGTNFELFEQVLHLRRSKINIKLL